jgi:hypothetical protein
VNEHRVLAKAVEDGYLCHHALIRLDGRLGLPPPIDSIDPKRIDHDFIANIQPPPGAGMWESGSFDFHHFRP